MYIFSPKFAQVFWLMFPTQNTHASKHSQCLARL